MRRESTGRKPARARKHVTRASSRGILSRMGQYVNDLDRVGKVATLVGLLPAVTDVLALMLGGDLPIPPLLALVIFAVTFAYANFRLYEGYNQPDVEIVVLESLCEFSDAIGSNVPGNDVLIPVGFRLEVTAHFDILVNQPELADAYFRIHAIDTDWDIDLSQALAAEVSVSVTKPDFRAGNPVVLRDRNVIPKCEFAVSIPIQPRATDQIRYHPYRFIGSLSRFDVTIGVDVRARRIQLPPMSPDIVAFHRTVEQGLIQLCVRQARHGRDVVPNAIFALRDLWQETLPQRASEGSRTRTR